MTKGEIQFIANKEVLKGEIIPKPLVFEKGRKELIFSFGAPNTGIFLEDKTTNKKTSWIMTEPPYLPDSFIANIRNNLAGQNNTYFYFSENNKNRKGWFEETKKGNFILKVSPGDKPDKIINSIDLSRDELEKIVKCYIDFVSNRSS